MPDIKLFNIKNGVGGQETARKFVMKNEPTSGFTILWEYDRLDLTIEASIIKRKYQPLFTKEEIDQCAGRLKEYGYLFDKE